MNWGLRYATDMDREGQPLALSEDGVAGKAKTEGNMALAEAIEIKRVTFR